MHPREKIIQSGVEFAYNRKFAGTYERCCTDMMNASRGLDQHINTKETPHEAESETDQQRNGGTTNVELHASTGNQLV